MEINQDYEFVNAINIGCPQTCETNHFDVDDMDRYYYAFNYHKWEEVLYICNDNAPYNDDPAILQNNWNTYRAGFGKWDTPNNSSAFLHFQHFENPGYS